jgi:hypothetical protein
MAFGIPETYNLCFLDDVIQAFKAHSGYFPSSLCNCFPAVTPGHYSPLGSENHEMGSGQSTPVDEYKVGPFTPESGVQRRLQMFVDGWFQVLISNC